MTDFDTRSQVAVDVFLVVCMCVIFLGFFFLTSTRPFDTHGRFDECSRMRVEERQWWWWRCATITRGYEGVLAFFFFFLNSFLSLVKRFHIRLYELSDKSFLFFLFLFFSYDSGHADSLTHGEIYYEYNNLDTLQTPTWAYDVALKHRRNRRVATSDDIGIGI